MIVEEAMDIFKSLTPQNRAYIMALVRMADVAEKNIKEEIVIGQQDPVLQQNEISCDWKEL